MGLGKRVCMREITSFFKSIQHRSELQTDGTSKEQDQNKDMQNIKKPHYYYGWLHKQSGLSTY